MNLQIIQTAIQSGYTFNESDSEEVEWDSHLLNHMISNSSLIQDMDDDDINEIMECLTNGEFDSLVKVFSKDKIVRIYTEYNGSDETSEIYQKIEDETWVYFPDLEKLDSESIDVYCKYISDSDENYDKFMKAQDFFKYCLYKFENDEDIDSEDIERFLDNHIHNKLFTEGVCLSDGFQDSFNNYTKDRHGWNDSHENKLSAAWEMMEKFSEKVEEKFIDKQYYIYEDSFLSEDELLEREEEEKIEAIERMHLRFKEPYGRLRVEDCNWYLNEHEFSANISVTEGYMGLEDMTFAYITIDGERQGETAFDRAWISGRNFGDNDLQTSVFLDTVGEYLIKE